METKPIFSIPHFVISLKKEQKIVIGLRSRVFLKMFNHDNVNGNIELKWIMEIKIAYFNLDLMQP